MFVDKYRPKKLEQVVGNVDVINELKQIEGKPPHLFFSGKQGTGKTTVARAICRKVLGEDWRKSTLELNASDERGIDVIREKVKKFASTKALSGTFKIIFLDEADELTPNAQTALRTIIEDYSSNASFILACNYPHKIIDPLKSRCACYHFQPISKDQTLKLIAQVIRNENIRMDPEVGELVAESANGDMRKVLFTLESFKRSNKHITVKDFKKIANDEIEDMVNIIIREKEEKVPFPKAKDMLFKMMKEGQNPDEIIQTFFDVVMRTRMEGDIKLEMLILIAEYENRLRFGANPVVQLVGLLASVYKEAIRRE